MAAEIVRESIGFRFERSTKNTHRYQEDAVEGEELVGALYVKKSAVDVNRDGVTVTPSIIYLRVSAEYGNKSSKPATK